MTKKKQEKLSEDPILAASQNATQECIKFFALSQLFFQNEDIYNVNEIPEDNQFFQAAKNMAEELEIDWEKMSHEDSNRIVINLLTDQYYAINQGKEFSHKLSVSVTPKLKPQNNGGDAS